MLSNNPKINEAVSALRGVMVEEAAKVVGPLDLNFTLGGEAGICLSVGVDMAKQVVYFSVEKFLTDKHDIKRHVKFRVSLNEIPSAIVGSDPTLAELVVSQPGAVPFRDCDADAAGKVEL